MCIRMLRFWSAIIENCCLKSGITCRIKTWIIYGIECIFIPVLDIVGMADIKQQVGQQIREARKAKGLTQQEVADRLSVSKSAYSRYESGKQNITIETLQKIGEVLSLKLSVSYQ